MRRAWIVLLAGVCAGSAIAQETPAATTVDFAAISARGRALYAYDQAAWYGTDAIFALKPDTKGLTRYLCMKTPTGWEVVFPKWNETHDQLVAVYEARETGGRFVARKLERPVPLDPDLAARERALELAIADFPAPTRPYNTAILPTADGNLYVYLYPGQTSDKVWPLGGDIRYTVSADGRTILEKRRLHNTILEMEVKANQKAGYHTHAITSVPEDTDVLYVLNRKPAMPEFIGTAKQLFIIDKEGNIETGRN